MYFIGIYLSDVHTVTHRLSDIRITNTLQTSKHGHTYTHVHIKLKLL